MISRSTRPSSIAIELKQRRIQSCRSLCIALKDFLLDLVYHKLTSAKNKNVFDLFINRDTFIF